MRERGWGATRAFDHLRARQPAAVESPEQEAFLDRYEASLLARKALGG